jgi:regulator of cell morphogenesis and NO signaling
MFHVEKALDDEALIAHICDRYHETHRRELPVILALARDLEACGGASGLAQALAAMAAELELHMFKEEMRLFPMMEQGGNTLLWQLVDAMRTEHGAQRDQITRLQSDLSQRVAPAGAETLLALLHLSAGKLFADLIEHMEVEDKVLFERFACRAGSGRSALR